MRTIVNMILFCSLLSACHHSNNSKRTILEGTLWTSDFYHYHNNYYFITDSTGYSQNGQYMWSTPIDPSLYNNSRDSICYDKNDPFKYTLNDTVLTIKYSLTVHDTINDHRIFYLQKGDS